MIGETFEPSADMRIHELERSARGLTPRVVSTFYDNPDGTLEDSEGFSAPFVARGALVTAAIHASPSSALITGTLVTVVFAVVNESAETVSDVRVSLPLPLDTVYVLNTLSIDGAPGSDAQASDIFELGTAIGALEAGARCTIVLKLTLVDGIGDILLAPRVTMRAGAVLGLRAMRLSRAVAAPRSGPIERPFYELDDDEDEQAAASLSSAPVTPPPAAVALKPDVAAFTALLAARASEPAKASTAQPLASTLVETADVRVHAAEAQTRLTAQAVVTAQSRANPPMQLASDQALPRRRVEVVRSIDDCVSIHGIGGPILAAPIDAKRVTTLGALFGGPSLGMIAHYFMLNALAVTKALPGDGDADALAAFSVEQERILSRALISTRLGKAPSATGDAATLPVFPDLRKHTAPHEVNRPAPGFATLLRAFDTDEVIGLQRTAASAAVPTFLRAMQLLAALCAKDAAVADADLRGELCAALSAYGIQAMGEVGRIFLRSKLSREPANLKATDSSFDDAARRALAVLARCVA